MKLTKALVPLMLIASAIPSSASAANENANSEMREGSWFAQMMYFVGLRPQRGW